MNAPIDPRRSHIRRFLWPAHLPPEPEVPVLDTAEASEQAFDDARFVDSFLRAETDIAIRDVWDSDG